MMTFPQIFAQASFWLEPAASTSAQEHDRVFYTVLYVTSFFFLLVVGLMLTFIVLYRRRRGVVGEAGPTHNTSLEVTWTGIPLIVVTVLFVMGLRAFLDFDTPPSNADVVDVEAKQWAFTFTYPSGAVKRAAVRRDRPPGDPSASLGRRAARPLHSRVSRPAQRRAGPDRGHVGQADQARLLPRLLHPVLRQRALADDHRSRGARRHRLRRQAGRVGQHLRRSGDEKTAALCPGGSASL